MRKLIYSINLTLDGCCDHTKGIGYEDIHEYYAQLMQHADVLVYGRITYQLMFPFWSGFAKNNPGAPKTISDFAKAITSVGKVVVFSHSLEKAERDNDTIVRTNLREEILKLKQEEGKDILTGGVDIPSQLLQLGLIDEFNIVVQPIVAGEGRRLFDEVNLPEKLQLKLVESKALPSGCVALRYVKR